MSDLNEIMGALGQALGKTKKPIILHEPIFDQSEKIFLEKCIESTFVSSVGRYVNEFENALSEFVGVKHVVLMQSGTAALQVALRASGVAPGDEVLVPSLSFVATANAVTYLGANPHFLDSDLHTLGMCPSILKDHLKASTYSDSGQIYNSKTRKPITAIVPMHTFGHPCLIEDLAEIANTYGLPLIEDAAEGLGSYYRGQHVGTFGKCGVLSFNGNKTITTGGGGAILTNDLQIASIAKHLSTTAKEPHAWEYSHDAIGYNYRMPNLNAALGMAQLEKIDKILDCKRRLANRYIASFEKVEVAKVIVEPKDCSSNYWLNTILLEKPNRLFRDEILKITNESKIMTRPVWKLLSELEHFKNCPSSTLNNAKLLSESLINIPSSPGILWNT